MATDRQTNPEESIACRDVMTPYPTSCQPSDTVEQVARQMQNENIGAIPVTDERHRVVGIVTDRDLALQVIGRHRKPAKVKVAAVMSRHPVTCGLNDHVRHALDTMAKHQVRRIPVVDHKHRLVGIIAQADIAQRVNSPRQTARVVKKISRPTNTIHVPQQKHGTLMILGSLLGGMLMYFFDPTRGAGRRRQLVEQLRSRASQWKHLGQRTSGFVSKLQAKVRSQQSALDSHEAPEITGERLRAREHGAGGFAGYSNPEVQP